MRDYAEDISLAELFGLKPEDYSEVDVLSLPFSIRVINRFRQKQINTVRDLLQVDITFLKGIYGLGATSLSEILSFCESLTGAANVLRDSKITRRNVSVFIHHHKDELALGDFSVFDAMDLSDSQIAEIARYREAYDILGEDVVFDCVSSPEKVFPIITALAEFVEQREKLKKIENLIYQIPSERRHNSSKFYIEAYTYDENLRKELSNCYSPDNDELDSIVASIDPDNALQIRNAEHFLAWCSFDLSKEISDLFSKVYTSPRMKTVIEGRANRQTLNDLGEGLGITRERVRQIEAKAKRIFTRLQSRIRIMPKLYAEQNGQTIITLEDIESVSGENSAALIYFLKSLDSSVFTYDAQLDTFVVGNSDLSSRIQDYLDSLPDVLRKNELADALRSAKEDYDLDPEYVSKAISEVYKTTGDVLHRTRLSLAKIYEATLRKHFEKGIHVYDNGEINRLRQCIYEDYGEIELPTADRAIAARIASICTLAGRGIYVPQKAQWISNGLAQKIYSYIQASKNPILLISTVYYTFEKELEAEGINNRYFLQGVLHELFGDKLYFRRDYISKDKGFTSIYSSIIAFIKEHHYPVKKDELKERFQGITDIVISLATSDSDILNYFGEYLHGSRLVIKEHEKAYLLDLLSKTTEDKEAHHIKDVYALICGERPEILTRNAVNGPYSAFSVLEYLFREQFQFSRPFIALNDVEIGRPSERLLELIYSSDDFTISGISEFARENHMQIQSLIEFVDSLNDKYLLRNQDTISSIASIGIDEEIAKAVETQICEEIDGTLPIRNLACLSRLPAIEYPWTDWLVYSVIRRWGKRLDVALSSSQLRQSIPLVSRRDEMDLSAYRDIDVTSAGIHVDNMDDIDELLGDILTEEMLEEIE